MSEKRLKREGQAVWFDRMRDWQESGLSKADYCRQHSLSPSNFYNWHRKYQQASSSEGLESQSRLQTGFIPVAIRAEASPSITISCGDVSVSFQGVMVPAQLAAWIKAMRASLC